MVNLLLWWLHKGTQLSKAAIKEKQLATRFLSSCHTPSVHAAPHQLQITAANSFQNSSSPLSHVPLLASMAERLLCYCSTACWLIWHDRNQFIISVLFYTLIAVADYTSLLLKKEWIQYLGMWSIMSFKLASLTWGPSVFPLRDRFRTWKSLGGIWKAFAGRACRNPRQHYFSRVLDTSSPSEKETFHQLSFILCSEIKTFNRL